MNINQVMRGFIGENHTGDAKMLELKEGQIVKGTVVKLLGEQEAIVNINGVQVRAKLETPLAAGQATMLQVQPESQSGQMILKPLNSSSVQIETGSMADLLKSFGMKESSVNRQLLQQMHLEDIPLTKENVQGISRMLAAIPADISSSEWIQSAILANKRGLPQSVATITALHQVVFGKPMHQSLKQLDEQLAVILKPDSSLPAALKVSLTQLKDTIKQIQAISANYSNNLVSDDTVDLSLHHGSTLQELPPGKVLSDMSQAGPANSNRPAINSIVLGQPLSVESGLHPPEALTSNAVTQRPILGNSTVVGNMPGISQETLPEAAQGSMTGMVPNNTLGTVTSITYATSQEIQGNPANTVPSSVLMTGNPNEPADIAQNLQTTLSKGSDPLNNLPAPSNQNIQGAGNETSKLVSLTPLSKEAVQGKMEEIISNKEVLPIVKAISVEETRSSPINSTVVDGNTSEQDNAELISRMLKAIGLEHENQVVKTLDSKQLNIGRTNSDLLHDLDPTIGNVDTSMVQRDVDKAADTLKSLLLQLSTADDLPQALKDNVHQLLQQVTGQQLFAISDRTSLFSHITLFLPINNANGEQTASVHVQSRRGKRGELDANNCRLLFDLHMKVLGETVVDVHVVNRIVALQVHNDHPQISEILELNRKEIASAVEKIGYQFLSMKSVPFPAKEEESKGLPTVQEINSSATSLYSSKPYKGMDVRV